MKVKMASMLRLYLILNFLSFSVSAESSDDRKNSGAEIVKSDDFSVRRFQEIIAAATKDSARSPQEELIALRAKLLISERRWNQLKELTPTEEPATGEKHDVNRAQLLRASQSEMNHYQAKIAKLEDQILKEKRRERENTKKPLKKRK